MGKRTKIRCDRSFLAGLLIFAFAGTSSAQNYAGTLLPFPSVWFSLKNLTYRTVIKPSGAFSNDPDDPVCGLAASSPQLPKEPWLPTTQQPMGYQEEVIGIVAAKWRLARGGRPSVEIAALPCISYRIAIVLSWPVRP
jgi:hypothetical protein